MSRLGARYLIEQIEQKRRDKLMKMSIEEREAYLKEEIAQIERLRDSKKRHIEFRKSQINRIDRQVMIEHISLVLLIIGLISWIVFFK
jgi:hypothetical protein